MKKVLVIRFSSIGDIVLTTPVLRCLKKQLAGVEVHYLTKTSFVPILENNPYIDKIHSINDRADEVIEALKKENFDFIVDLHHNLRTAQVKRKLKTPSASFNKLNIEKFLLVRFKINKLPDTHIVDRYLATLKHLGVTNDGKGLDYFIPEKDEVSIDNLPVSHRNGYVGFVIGAAHFTKQLPTEKIISICKKINQSIVLLGGKEDEAKSKIITKALGEQVYNACNIYNINQSASLIRQADKILTHDTGLMHIAAAFQKPIVSVWGNTVPEFGMYVYKGQGTGDKGRGTSEKWQGESDKGHGLGDRGKGKREKWQGSGDMIVEVKNLSCRPCSKIGYNKCPKGHFKCMNEISEEKIIISINS